VATNPGFFMDPQANKFLWGLASGLDLIGIWSVVLTGLGFAICSADGKLRPNTAIITVLVVYAVIIAAFAALGAAV
jgi:anaerobic C4-dicarboxylate transporter